MDDLTLEQAGDKTFGKCDCCGSRSRKVWGYVNSLSFGGAHAVYYARWADGNREHGLSMLVSIHGWGEGADETRRRLVSVYCRLADTGPQFMALDEPDSEWGGDLTRFGKVVNRDNLLSSPLRREVFDVVDLVFAKDRRVRGFVYPRPGVSRIFGKRK